MGKRRFRDSTRTAVQHGANRLFRGCIGKKSYSSKRSALGIRRVMDDATLTAYKCHCCGKWHLGHDKRKGN